MKAMFEDKSTLVQPTDEQTNRQTTSLQNHTEGHDRGYDEKTAIQEGYDEGHDGGYDEKTATQEGYDGGYDGGHDKFPVDHLTLSPIEIAILDACSKGPRKIRELLAVADTSSKTGHFRRTLNKLLNSKFIAMTIPDRPRSKNQQYRLTEKGRYLLEHQHKNGDS